MDTVMDGYFRGRRYRSQTYVRFKFCHPNRRAGEMEREQKGGRSRCGGRIYGCNNEISAARLLTLRHFLSSSRH